MGDLYGQLSFFEVPSSALPLPERGIEFLGLVHASVRSLFIEAKNVPVFVFPIKKCEPYEKNELLCGWKGTR
jgi:hypothetical protein